MTPDLTHSVVKSNGTQENHIERDKPKNEHKISNDDPGTVPLWRSCRLFVAIIGAVVMSTSIASQTSMTSAMVCMFKDEGNENRLQNETNILMENYATSNRHVSTNTSATDEYWKLDYDSETQGWIVSSFFFGYFFMQIPSGIIVTRLGPKSSMTFGLITTGILQLITIPVALWSLPMLYFVRTVAGLACGFMYPGIFALVANWCPRQETSLMFSLPCIGFEFGNSFIFLVSLIGCELNFQGGWPTVFYTLGAIEIAVGLIMLVGVTNFPSSNRFISHEEEKYITKYRVHEEKANNIPYGKIFQSVPVWAFLMGQFAIEYAYYTIITQGPVYLRDILKLSHWKINAISSIPFLLVTPCAFIVGYLSDKVVAKKILSTTGMRKSNEAISKILLAVTLSILAVLPVGEFVSTFFIYLIAGLGIQFCYIGFMANPADLSPAHAGFLAGLGQALTTWVSFVIPVLTGNLASKKTREGWYFIFFIAVGLQILCLIFFLLFGSGNLQLWATPPTDEKLPIIDKKNKDDKKDGTRPARYRTLSL